MATATVKKTSTKSKKTTTFSPFMKRSINALKASPSWGSMLVASSETGATKKG